MKTYKAYFLFGRGVSYCAEFDHEYKHFSDDDFDKEMEDFAKRIGAIYLYKEMK